MTGVDRATSSLDQLVDEVTSDGEWTSSVGWLQRASDGWLRRVSGMLDITEDDLPRSQEESAVACEILRALWRRENPATLISDEQLISFSLNLVFAATIERIKRAEDVEPPCYFTIFSDELEHFRRELVACQPTSGKPR
jgi:hypothetical protein